MGSRDSPLGSGRYAPMFVGEVVSVSSASALHGEFLNRPAVDGFDRLFKFLRVPLCVLLAYSLLLVIVNRGSPGNEVPIALFLAVSSLFSFLFPALFDALRDLDAERMSQWLARVLAATSAELTTRRPSPLVRACRALWIRGSPI